jgi:hypothetical protein
MEIGTRIDPLLSGLLAAWLLASAPSWAVHPGRCPIEGASQ